MFLVSTPRSNWSESKKVDEERGGGASEFFASSILLGWLQFARGQDAEKVLRTGTLARQARWRKMPLKQLRLLL